MSKPKTSNAQTSETSVPLTAQAQFANAMRYKLKKNREWRAEKAKKEAFMAAWQESVKSRRSRQ